MIKSTLSGIAILMLIAAPNSFGAEKSVSFQEAVDLALSANHELRAFGYAVSAQKEDIGIAQSFLLPTLRFEERFMRTNNPPSVFSTKLNQERFSQSDFAINSLNDPKAINDFQTSLSFEQPLFARQSSLGAEMAKIQYRALDKGFLRKREELALKVAQSFLTVKSAQEQLAASERAVEDAQEHARIAQLRYTSELGLYSDTLRASTAVSETEQRVVSTKRLYETARRGLGLLLGLSESVSVSGETPQIPLLDLAYYVDAAQSRHDIQSMELQHEHAQKGVQRAAAGYLPTFGIGGAYQLNDHRVPLGAEGQSWQIGAFLRWDLFNGFKTKHEKTKAQLKASEADEQLAGLKNAVSYSVYEAYLRVQEAQKNVELARAALKSAEEGARLVRMRYQNSLSPLIDLLDAQVNLDQAQAGLITKENEYRFALLNLANESGILLKVLKIE